MAASATGWPRPRRRSRPRGPPPCFYLRPHLLLPQLNCVVVTFDRPAGRLLPGPAMALQQPPRPEASPRTRAPRPSRDPPGPRPPGRRADPRRTPRAVPDQRSPVRPPAAFESLPTPLALRPLPRRPRTGGVVPATAAGMRGSTPDRRRTSPRREIAQTPTQAPHALHAPSVNEPDSPNRAPGNFRPHCAQSRPVHRSSTQRSFSSAELRAVHRHGLVAQRLRPLPDVSGPLGHPEIVAPRLPHVESSAGSLESWPMSRGACSPF